MSVRVVERGWYARLESGNWQEIPGAKRLRLAGFEDLDLCLARYSDPRSKYWGIAWVVTEGKTGMAVGTGETRAKALATARSRLERRRSDLERVIEEGIRTNGLSPRYRQEKEEA